MTAGGLATGLSLPSSSQVVCVKESAKQTCEEKYSTVGNVSLCSMFRLWVCVFGKPAWSVIVEPVA